MFQSFFGSLLNHLYNYSNENVLVKHLSLICITSIKFINTIYLLKNCSFHRRCYCIYSPKSFRFFRKEFHYVRKINKYINYLLRVGLFETSVTVFHHKVLCGHISVPSYEKLTLEEQIISKDKYASMFLHKIEAVVFIILQIFCNACKKFFYKHGIFCFKGKSPSNLNN